MPSVAVPSVPGMPGVRTWLDGVEVASDDRAWSVRAAEFLGCGFRAQVPSGGGPAALAFLCAQVQELAHLLGADFDPAPWAAAATQVVHGAPALLEGGWESVFRAPLGPPLTRVCPGARPATLRTAVALPLPWSVPVGSDLSRMPLHSSHEDRVALLHLTADRPDEAAPVGLWHSPEGRLVRTTAGAAWLHTRDRGWLHAAPGPGVVPTWIGAMLQDALASAPAALDHATLTAPGSTLVAVDAWGTLSVLLRGSGEAPHAAAVAHADEALSGILDGRGATPA